MTGNELFYSALDLCGLRNNDGSVPSDVDDLKQRALNLINIIIAENAELDGRIRKSEHSVNTISTLEDTVDCTDIVAFSVLPYGLARLFCIGEDDALANKLTQLYNEARAKALTFGKARTEAITEVYE